MFSDRSIILICRDPAGNFKAEIVGIPGQSDQRSFLSGWSAPFQEIPGVALYSIDYNDGEMGVFKIVEKSSSGDRYDYRNLGSEELFLRYSTHRLPAIVDFKILPNDLIVLRTIINELYLAKIFTGKVIGKLAESIDEFAVAPDGRIFARSDYKIYVFDGEKSK
jgi:hypothetical protein